jgi:hypothetical protein
MLRQTARVGHLLLIQMSKNPAVIASQRVRAKRGPMTGFAKQSRLPPRKQSGLLRRSAPRNDDLEAQFRILAAAFARGLL